MVESLIQQLSSDENTARKALAQLIDAGETSVKPLIAAWPNQPLEVKRKIAIGLGKLGDTHAIPLLQDALLHQHELSTELTRALRRLKAVEALLSALKSEIATVRSAAAYELGLLGNRATVIPLVELLDDPERNVRSSAVDALGRLGDSRAVEPLLQILMQTRPEFDIDGQTTHDSYIRDLFVSRAMTHIDARLPEKLLSHPDPLVKINVLTLYPHQLSHSGIGKLLNDADPIVRYAAMRALRIVNANVAPHLLMSAARDVDGGVRAEAIRLLAVRRKSRSLPLALTALTDPDERVRYAVVTSNFQQRIPESSLINSLHDESAKVRVAVVRAVAARKALKPLFEGVLKDPELEVRVAAIHLLRNLQAEDTHIILRLIESVSDANPRISLGSAGALRRSGFALLLLVRALKNENQDARLRAAEILNTVVRDHAPAMYSFSDEDRVEMVAILTQALESEEAILRLAALKTFAALEDPLAVAPLLRCFYNTSEPQLRETVAIILSRFDDERIGEAFRSLPVNMEGRLSGIVNWYFVRIFGDDGVKYLLPALQDEKRYVAAALFLAWRPTEQAVEPLIELLLDENKPGRSWAAIALGKIGDARAVEPLIHALNFVTPKHPRIDAHAARALGKLKDPRAVEPLMQAFHVAVANDDGSGAAAFAEALIGVKRPEMIPDLVRALDMPHPDLKVKAILALGGLGDLHSINVLADLLRDETYYVRETAAIALSRLKDPQVVEPLLSAWHALAEPIQTAVLYGFSRIGDKRAISLFIELLQSNSYVMRKRAGIGLVNIGRAAVPALLELLHSPDVVLRSRVLTILGLINDKDVLGNVRQALHDTETPVRAKAAEALGLMHDLHSLNALCFSLSDKSPWVRACAATALGKLAQPEAIEHLEKHSADTKKNVRLAVAASLSKLR